MRSRRWSGRSRSYSRARAHPIRACLGPGVCDRRRGLLDCHASARARETLDGCPPRCKCSPAISTSEAIHDGPRRPLPRDDHGRRQRGTTAAVLRQGSQRLPRPSRTARDGPVRHPRPAQGRPVLADGPDFVPQPADLSESRGPGARPRHVSFRAQSRRTAVSGNVGIGRREQSPLRDAGQEDRIYCCARRAQGGAAGTPGAQRTGSRDCRRSERAQDGARRPRQAVPPGVGRRLPRSPTSATSTGRHWPNCTSGSSSISPRRRLSSTRTTRWSISRNTPAIS